MRGLPLHLRLALRVGVAETELGQLHRDVIPVELPLRLIELYTYRGDLVVDPFMGSGTVAKACHGLGRRFIGAERVPLYQEIAARRMDPTYITAARAAESVGPLFAR